MPHEGVPGETVPTEAPSAERGTGPPVIVIAANRGRPHPER